MKSVIFLLAISVTTFQASVFCQKAKSENSDSEPVQKQPHTIPVSNKLIELLKISAEEEQIYAELVQKQGAKILKLWNNLCENTKILDVKDENCLNQYGYTVGSQYSFIKQMYQPFYGDLSLISGNFIVRNHGDLLTQLLVDLGKTDFAGLSKHSPEVKKLVSYKDKGETEKTRKIKFSEGFDFRGLKITTKHKLRLNHIYLLRSIEFWGERRYTWGKDSIFVFQPVKQDQNVVTLIWKKIRDKWV
jgi:hypothetical protein